MNSDIGTECGNGTRPALILIITVLLVCSEAAPGAQQIDLHQGWSRATSETFWFSSQGSRIMPYAWFIALEQGSSLSLLRDPAFMESLGYIVPGPSARNPNNLPIGFARDENRLGTASYAGLTCAACHTGRMLIGGRSIIVEGGPALSDFSGLLNAIVDSTRSTLADSEKFARFAARVGALTPPEQVQLRTALIKTDSELTSRRDQNAPSQPFGVGRVDAFSHIFNRVLSSAVGVAGNTRRPEAPVSYPFLWDTPQHDVVQWNGSAPNQRVLGLGALFRNIGELLGVFGQFDLTNSPPFGVPYYRVSSVRGSKLNVLEGLVAGLRSPEWPRNVLPLDSVRVSQGAALYAAARCNDCHAILGDRTDPRRRIEAKLIDAAVVGTDVTMTTQFATIMNDPQFRTGVLEGRLKASGSLGKFGPTASGAEILNHVLLGVYAGQLVAPAADQLRLNSEANLSTVRLAAPEAGLARTVYKARPLNGVWATAPFLHNGSVPSLRELLKPAKDRVAGFWVGSREFDDQGVGFSTAEGPHAFWFDTTNPGNANTGHEYGVDLTEDQKRALVEFIKTL